MKKNVLFILLLLLICIIIKPSLLHVNFHTKHKTLAQELELTQEQIKFEKILREENKSEVKPILKKLEKDTKDYKKLIEIKAKSKKILEKKEEINQLSEKYNNVQKEHLQKFEKILNKEQKDKFHRITTQLFLAD